MYLKRLDLQGFKSFPEKVKLEFNKGITTVVGPNGSGKSNISDSIRWVLGEQKAKSLRGDKMEDVIFAGTSNRKPLGFAEVSITLDNEGSEIPLDYTDITVTRTVYRSGESRYMINGTVCRLKDVHELFMDTGIGKEGYSIIGQGRIDEILSSKGEDRRMLFEEATGIVKFRNRRFEAMGKLEKEQQNLLRVEDIISELESKLEPLKKQTEVARKYLALKENLKKYEVNNFYLQANKIEASMCKLKEAVEISNYNIKTEKENYDEAKKLIEINKEKEREFISRLQKINDDIAILATEIEKNEGEIKLCCQQIEHIDTNTKRIDAEKTLNEQKAKAYNNDESIFKAKIMALDMNISSLNTALNGEEEKFGKLSGVLAQGEEQIEEYKADMIEKIKITTDLKSNIKHTEAMRSQFNDRHEQIVGESKFIESQVFEAKVQVAVLEKTLEEKNVEEKNLEEALGILESQKNILDEKSEENKRIYNAKASRLNECKSKLKILTEMKTDFEGFFKSVKSILKLRNTKGFEGICGAVGEVISVEKKYETAMEIAVGQAMQSIITENEQDAKKAIEYLKVNNLGRCTFLPITVIKGKDLNHDREKIVKFTGVVGIAKELISYDKKYENVIGSLLGRVIIVENMDFALAVAKETGHQYRLVTMDGDVINPGGTMTGGSLAKKASGIFSRTREIGELEKEAENLEIVISKANEIITKYSALLAENAEKTIAANNNIQQIHILLASVKQEIIQHKSAIDDKNQRYQNSVLEEKILAQQMENAHKDMLEMNAGLENAEKEISQINMALEQYQGTLQSDKNNKDEILSKITEIKIAVSTGEQEKSSVCENLKRIKKERAVSEDEIKLLTNQRDEFLSTRVIKEMEMEELSQCVVELKEKQKNLDALKYNANVKLLEIKDDTEKTEERLRLFFENVNKLENDVFKSETKLEKLNEEKERIYNDVWDEYEVTYQGARAAFDQTLCTNEIASLTKQIKGEIKELGDVNVNAIEEYKTVSERYTFLTVQRDDIRNAEEKLQKIIDELAIMMQAQFKEQFEIINKNFNIVFREMFGGGNAYLKMADSENVLEGGIDIIAQPPGKTLQNMLLLSGGERALTAIAILFAILKMKPSPFCILDEIEAALDEANVKRFANYLRDFSRGTQFIVITHRKGTMEAADVMYGVTMQEQGVSKVISVKFGEKAV